jgi:dihydroflavonol-4-reductase
MKTVLVTGATGFIGYHVVRRLLERGIRPRALARRSSDTSHLRALDVELVEGDVEHFPSLREAMAGAGTVFHVAGMVSTDPADAPRLYQVNVAGTRHVLDAAAGAGVSRVVVTSSVAAVGVHAEPRPLDESAPWESRPQYPYAATKRQAEEDALAMARRGLPVVVVNPSIVIGPEDFGPSAGGRHVKDLMDRRVPAWIRMGLAYVDARDVAEGHLLAAERGRPGERYILSAHNLMLDEFFRQAAAAAGVPPPRWQVPLGAAYAMACLFEAWAVVARRRPLVTRGVLQSAGKYAWYDATRARTELGWTTRPLEETLQDTVAWFRRGH